jgi:hypothetical protein
MKKPHILIFNPDQFRADCLGHMRCVAAKTPIMDQLAHNEAVFSPALLPEPPRLNFARVHARVPQVCAVRRPVPH